MDDQIGPPEASVVPVTRRQAMGALGVLTAGTAATAARGETPAAISGSAPQSPLYPHESPTRATRDLSGLWSFKLDPKDAGEQARWFDGLPSPRRIPVPCSWNDLFDDAADYFDAAWYRPSSSSIQAGPGGGCGCGSARRSITPRPG